MSKLIIGHHMEKDYLTFHEGWTKDDKMADILEGLHKRYQRNIELIQKRPAEVSEGGSSNLLDLLGQMNLLNWDKKQTQWLLHDLWELLEMHYEIALHPGETVMVQYEGIPFKTVGKHTVASNNLKMWLNAVGLALITRQTGFLRLLLEFDTDNIALRFKGEMDYDPERRFEKAMVRLIRGLFQSKADMAALLKEAATYSAPEYIGDEYAQNFVYGFYLPLVPLIAAMYRHDREEAYPRALVEAIEAHKAQASWEATEEELAFIGDNKWDARLWFSLPIAGLAALAYDRWGLALNVDTQYVPEWWVIGEIPHKRIFAGDVFPKFRADPN